MGQIEFNITDQRTKKFYRGFSSFYFKLCISFMKIRQFLSNIKGFICMDLFKIFHTQYEDMHVLLHLNKPTIGHFC